MNNKKYYLVTILLFLQFNLFSQQEKKFVENFNDNQNNWQLSKNSNSNSKIKNGKLIVRNKNDNSQTALWQTFYIDPTKDFTITTSIGQYSGTTSQSYGIIWGAADWNNYFCLLLSSSYYFKIYKVRNNKYKDIVNWKSTDAIYPKYFLNEIQIEKIGSEIKFYINNSIVHIMQFKALYGTQIAFIASNEITIKIDYLKIDYTENKLNLCKPISSFQKKSIDLKLDPFKSAIAPIISADNKTLYFSTQNNFSDTIVSYDIFQTQINEMGFWSVPQQLSSDINNQENNLSIYIYPDEKTIIYQNENKDGEQVVLMSKIEQNNKVLPDTILIENYINKFQYADFCLSQDRKILLSALQTNDTYGNKDLYVSFLTDKGIYSEPVNMGGVINTYDEEGTPFLAADNKTLYFFSYGHAGYGSSDIFVSKRLDDTWTNWSTPENLGKNINSSSAEAFFIIDSEQKFAYFVSNCEGIEKIYKIRLD